MNILINRSFINKFLKMLLLNIDIKFKIRLIFIKLLSNLLLY